MKVAVRCRPFNSRERKAGAGCIVKMEAQTTLIYEPETSREPRQFTFDHSFWSCDDSDSHFASQQHVYDHVGSMLLEDAFQGL